MLIELIQSWTDNLRSRELVVFDVCMCVVSMQRLCGFVWMGGYGWDELQVVCGQCSSCRRVSKIK